MAIPLLISEFVASSATEANQATLCHALSCCFLGQQRLSTSSDSLVTPENFWRSCDPI
jgi:hypothetical protein